MILDSLKATLEYLKSLQGLLSLLPGIVAVIDSHADLLRISSAIKPLVYVLAICFILYVLLSEVSKYIQTKATSPEFNRMRKKAPLHVFLFLVVFGIYWIGIRYFETNLPEKEWLEQAIIYGFALAVAVAFAEITRAFAILGLRIYIATYRP